jgi:hypothetical protein
MPSKGTSYGQVELIMCQAYKERMVKRYGKKNLFPIGFSEQAKR